MARTPRKRKSALPARKSAHDQTEINVEDEALKNALNSQYQRAPYPTPSDDDDLCSADEDDKLDFEDEATAGTGYNTTPLLGKPTSFKEPAILRPQGLPQVETTVDDHWTYLFFRFCAERHKMYDRRQAGIPRDQLTKDETMSKEHIGNVFRQLDPSSKNIGIDIIGKGDQSHEEVCFRLFLYCMFYSEATWNALCTSIGGIPTWRNYISDLPVFESVLHRISFIENKKIYYGGFQLVPPTVYFTDNRNRDKTMFHYAASLRLVLAMMLAKLPDQLLKCQYAVDASHVLQTIPTLGGFLSWNILCFLNDTTHFTWYFRNYATCGPGPRSYLGRIFGGKNVINSIAMEEAGLIWLYENQWKYWARLGEDPPHAHEIGLRPGMRVLDFENALCWCHRYVNAFERKRYGNFGHIPHPEYDPEITENTSAPAWCTEERWMKSTSKAAWVGDYDEAQCKLESVDGQEEVYEVEKIVMRKGLRSEKNSYFRVRWKGYTPEEDTWEKADSLKDGAEETLEDWVQWENRVWDNIEKVKRQYPFIRPQIPKSEPSAVQDENEQGDARSGRAVKRMKREAIPS
ncbi:uncharacterized protein IL334_004491 [Kwoniella shivajii]|uniref:Chromo domain-containing protein n=1 Tax=Kwoniella shivajii TaxID=564305 RepID=A0ABZ1D2E1_9TREE|nr:hypothetical protein IL334_004491 [Kwoniella shivajii]